GGRGGRRDVALRRLRGGTARRLRHGPAAPPGRLRRGTVGSAPAAAARQPGRFKRPRRLAQRSTRPKTKSPRGISTKPIATSARIAPLTAARATHLDGGRAFRLTRRRTGKTWRSPGVTAAVRTAS